MAKNAFDPYFLGPYGENAAWGGYLASIFRREDDDPKTLREVPDDPEVEVPSLLLIRNTLMNPWLGFEENGRNYIDMYLDFLEERILAEINGRQS